MRVLNVRYRKMTAIQWDGADETFEAIKAALARQHISESLHRTDDTWNGKDCIRFWLSHSANHSNVIPLEGWLVIPEVPGAQAIILKDYDFHARFEPV